MVSTLLRSVQKHHLVILFVVAAVLRIGYVFTLDETFYYYDTKHYDEAAQSIVSGEGFGKSYHFAHEYKYYCLEPVFPIFLAGIYGVFGHSYLAVRLVHVLLSLLQLWLLFQIANRIRPPAGSVVLAFGAIYPFFIYIAGLLYVTQLFSLLVTLCVYLIIRYAAENHLKWALWAGLVLGAAAAARPVILPAAGLFGLWFLIFSRKPLNVRFGHAVLFGGVVALVLVPWTIRNVLVYDTLSPGRACLAETRIFHEVDVRFRYWDSFAQPTFEGDSLHIKIERKNSRHIFHVFLDGHELNRALPFDTLQIADSAYFGLMLRGGEPITWPRVHFTVKDGEHTRTIAPDSTFLHDNAIRIDTPAIHLEASEEAWQYRVIFPNPARVESMELIYPDPVTPRDMQRLAFMIGLDEPALDADGYMVWLQPWQDLDMWRIENGTPESPINYEDLLWEENPPSLQYLLKTYPVRFFTEHVIPEFLNFWSPTLDRVETRSNTSTVKYLASLIFFTPLLIFGIIGLFGFRGKAAQLWTILIPIITISGFYSIFFTELRYRLPIDGLLIVLAAVGAALIYQKLRGPRKSK